jgi:hypothetical protein
MRFAILMLGLTTILLTGPGVALNDAELRHASDTNSGTTPPILESNEGEHRVRRRRETPIPTAEFMIKIDRKNGG